MNRMGTSFWQRARRVRWNSSTANPSEPLKSQAKQQTTHTHVPKFEAPKEEKKGIFGKAATFFYNNRQGFINIFVVYLAVSMGITNYKNSLEYEDLKAKFATEQEKNQSLTNTLDKLKSNNFVDDAVNKIQATPNLEKKRDALRNLLSEVLKQDENESSGKTLPVSMVPTKEKEEDAGAVLQQFLTEESTSTPKSKKLRLM